MTKKHQETTEWKYPPKGYKYQGGIRSRPPRGYRYFGEKVEWLSHWKDEFGRYRFRITIYYIPIDDPFLPIITETPYEEVTNFNRDEKRQELRSSNPDGSCPCLTTVDIPLEESLNFMYELGKEEARRAKHLKPRTQTKIEKDKDDLRKHGERQKRRTEALKNAKEQEHELRDLARKTQTAQEKNPEAKGDFEEPTNKLLDAADSLAETASSAEDLRDSVASMDNVQKFGNSDNKKQRKVFNKILQKQKEFMDDLIEVILNHHSELSLKVLKSYSLSLTQMLCDYEKCGGGHYEPGHNLLMSLLEYIRTTERKEEEAKRPKTPNLSPPGIRDEERGIGYRWEMEQTRMS